MREIRESPLLTDEDLQLLTAAVPSCAPLCQDHTPGHTPCSGNSHASLCGDHALAALFLVVAVMGWWLHPLILIVGVAFILMYRLLSYWLDKLFSSAQIKRMEYYSAMDRLLTQLATTIRWLQEAEIVGRGLMRPLASLPANRLDSCHTHRLLRKRVLRTCTDVLTCLRAHTRELCARSRDLPPELADQGSYLAFTPLHTLHQFMQEDLMKPGGVAVGGADRGGGGADDAWSVSLDSIKVM